MKTNKEMIEAHLLHEIEHYDNEAEAKAAEGHKGLAQWLQDKADDLRTQLIELRFSGLLAATLALLNGLPTWAG